MASVGPLVFLGVLGLLVVAGLVTGVVLLYVHAGRQRERQAAGLAAYAAARGMSYRPGDPSLVDRFRGEPFGRGTGRRVADVVEGAHRGRPVVLFEYRWTTRSGDDRRHHHVYVVATALPTAVPTLALRPSSGFGRVVDALTGGEHEVGDPVFDAAYRVFTDSPDFAADVLDPATRAWLLAQQPPYFRLSRADLLVMGRGPLTPETADRALAFAAAVVERVPERVWARAAGRLL